MSSDGKIRFQCPFCDKSVAVPEKFDGQRGKCPGCGNLMLIVKTTEPIENAEEVLDRKLKKIEDADVRKPARTFFGFREGQKLEARNALQACLAESYEPDLVAALTFALRNDVGDAAWILYILEKVLVPEFTPIIFGLCREDRLKYSQASKYLAAAGGSVAYHALLEIFRIQTKGQAGLTENGGVIEDKKPKDMEAAYHLANFPGAIPQLTKECTTAELERILVLGCNYGSPNEDVTLALGKLGTRMAVGRLIARLINVHAYGHVSSRTAETRQLIKRALALSGPKIHTQLSDVLNAPPRGLGAAEIAAFQADIKAVLSAGQGGPDIQALLEGRGQPSAWSSPPGFTEHDARMRAKDDLGGEDELFALELVQLMNPLYQAWRTAGHERAMQRQEWKDARAIGTFLNSHGGFNRMLLIYHRMRHLRGGDDGCMTHVWHQVGSWLT